MNVSVTQEVIVYDWFRSLDDTVSANHQNLTDIVLTSPLTDAVYFVGLYIDKVL